MIFLFNRIFGTKARERLESFEIEAENLEAAIQTIKSNLSHATLDRRGDNLYFSWQESGKDMFDFYYGTSVIDND